MADTLGAGRYVIVGVLGEGSQGRTFDAIDKRAGRPVAIKRFDVRGAHAWKDVELAERETRVLQGLSHPNLPHYVDHFEQDGVLYLVTEKIEGASLAALRRQGVPFGEKEAMRLLGDAALVLGYLQDRSPPVVHRDIKPANIVRRPDGSYAFVDFGAVRDSLRPEGGSTIVGTFGYMAPEQFQGRALPGSDVYGVGATVLSLLADAEPENLPHRGLAIDVRAALRGRAVSERLTRILERMLEPDPDRRPQAIRPLLEAREERRPGPATAGWSPRDAHASAHELREQGRHFRRSARDEARAWRRQHRHRRGVGWPLEVLFTLVFSVGLVVVSVVTQIAVPLLLRVLSLFFARRALTQAAEAVQDAGGAAVRSIAQSRRWMRGEPPVGAGPVATGPQPTRVDASVPPIRVVPLDAEDELDDEQEPGARRRR